MAEINCKKCDRHDTSLMDWIHISDEYSFMCIACGRDSIMDKKLSKRLRKQSAKEESKNAKINKATVNVDTGGGDFTGDIIVQGEKTDNGEKSGSLLGCIFRIIRIIGIIVSLFALLGGITITINLYFGNAIFTFPPTKPPSTEVFAQNGEDPPLPPEAPPPAPQKERIEWDDGEYYGYLQRRIPHGSDGTLTWTQDHRLRVYKGEFYRGQRTGQGTLYWHNDDVYVGAFLNGLKHGHGKMTWYSNDGRWYEGGWQNGMRNGDGTIGWVDETLLIGFWHNDRLVGEGTMIHPDGRRYQVIEENGEFVPVR